ncbi:MAG: hypothetical protein S4CHLAM81_00920 [Chlamydiales bacterium]|nr:hypothetical protein [Chlamydiales bacterium]MCH9634888.1 hypothetical protein [Chlamydiales bacterium]MCH9703700.1 hypothetical protein [Chlamydiota bacterium]
MEIQIKCKLEEEHLKLIRKYAKLVEKSELCEIYTFMGFTAKVEDGLVTISLAVKSEKDAPKAQKKLLAVVERFGLEQC